MLQRPGFFVLERNPVNRDILAFTLLGVWVTKKTA